MPPELKLSALGNRLPPAEEVPEGFEADDFERVVNLSFGDVEQLIAGCSPENVRALRAFAEHGPKVHGSLIAPHVHHLGEFNKSINEYAQTFSAGECIYLFTWDDWPSHKDEIGFYALSAASYRSLRKYFALPEAEQAENMRP